MNFFGSRHLPAFTRIPVQDRNPVSSPPRSTPNVVSIPVRFMESVKARSETESAVRIQRVFRGFLVRKFLKMICSVRGEVDELERRLSDPGVLDLIRSDSKERLKVNEQLMALLFRLDSVPGVDAGVKDCRKAVIKKAIALQDSVEGLSSNDSLREDPADRSDCAIEFQPASSLEFVTNGKLVRDEGEDDLGNTLNVQFNSSGERNISNRCLDCPTAVSGGYAESVLEPNSASPACRDSATTEAVTGNNLKENFDDRAVSDVAGILHDPDKMIPVVCEEKHVVASAAVCEEDKRTGVDDSLSNSNKELSELALNSPVMADGSAGIVLEGCGKRCRACGAGREEGNEGMGVLERMMEDNAKLRRLVEDLCERNAAQTRLLGSLSRRVDELERGLGCEKRNRKKRRSSAAEANHGSSDRSDSSK